MPRVMAPNWLLTCENATAYSATVVNYKRKMFMKFVPEVLVQFVEVIPGVNVIKLFFFVTDASAK
jgi:hypothetical protein